MSKKAEQARLQARIEFDRKYPLELKLKDWFWKQLEKVDPIKTAALAATTFLVYNVVIALDDNTKARILRWETTSIVAGLLPATLAEATIFGQTFQSFDQMFYYEIEETVIHTKEGDFTTRTPRLMMRQAGETGTPEKGKGKPVIGWSYLIFSFVLAYMIVEHGGEILGMMMDGGKTIGTLVTAMLPAA